MLFLLTAENIYNKMTAVEIISYLPYQAPFLFVDQLHKVTEQGIEGSFTFKKSAYFYRGHFKDNPVTPGVILTETMAQIGVVCLGIYLLRDQVINDGFPKIALTSNAVDFYIPVYPGEKVKVVSELDYFRFSKLKCQVAMYNEEQELVCRGSISGMIKF